MSWGSSDLRRSCQSCCHTGAGGSVPARVWWGEKAPSVWCKCAMNFAFYLPVSRSLSARGYCRAETLRQGPLSAECHILNHLQGSCPTVISPGLCSDAIFVPSVSPGRSNYPLLQAPGVHGQAPITVRRPPSLPVPALCAVSFPSGGLCTGTFCTPETAPACRRPSGESAHAVRGPVGIYQATEKLCFLSYLQNE